MKLTKELTDKIQEAMLHTNLKGEINWKDGDDIEVQIAGTFAKDKFIVLKNVTKNPFENAQPHPYFDYEKKVFTKERRIYERTGEVKEMSEEELQEQIIQQIEVLVEELGGTMCHLTKCTYTGRQSKILQIEYNVEE